MNFITTELPDSILSCLFMAPLHLELKSFYSNSGAANIKNRYQALLKALHV